MDGNSRLQNLVQQAISGDKEAFSDLCFARGRGILYLCTQMMGNTQDGEDAAQEVFIRMQKGISSLKSPAAFSVWTQRIVLNTCNDLRRKSMKRNNDFSLDDYLGEIPDNVDAYLPQSYVEDSEEKTRLIKVIQELPQNYRVCVLLFYFENMPHAQIAEVLDTTPGAVNAMLMRAKGKIREKMELGREPAPEPTSLAAVVLGGALQQNAESVISSEAVRRCIEAAQAAATIIPIAATGGTAAAHAASSSMATKIVAGILSATVIAAGAGIALNQTASPPSAPSIQLSDSSAQTYAPQHSSAMSIVVDGSEDTASSMDADAAGTEPPAQPNPMAMPEGSAPEEPEEIIKPPEVIDKLPSPPSPIKPVDPGPQTIALTGRVLFCHNDGSVVEEAGDYASGYLARIEIDGRIVASAIVDEKGEYSFGNYPISLLGDVELVLQAASPLQPVPTQDNPDGRQAVELNADETQLPDTYITDDLPPALSISFFTELGAGRPVNPRQVRMFVGDNTDYSCVWRICDAKGEIYAEGEGTEIEAEVLDELESGVYTLYATATDAAGNVAEEADRFYIAKRQRYQPDP